MFDISHGKKVKEQEESGVLVPVTDEQGVVQEGVSITFVGSYSPTYQKNAEAYRQWNIDEVREPSATELNVAIYACGIKSWEGLTSDGNDFPCTIQNAVAVLDSCPWILDEAKKRVFNRSVFFPKPSAS